MLTRGFQGKRPKSEAKPLPPGQHLSGDFPVLSAGHAVRGHFSEKELTDLIWAVAAINAWNRAAIAFRSEAGTYKPGAHE